MDLKISVITMAATTRDNFPWPAWSLQRSLCTVCCGARLRFPDSDAGNPRGVGRLWKLLRCLIVNMARDVFRGWVQSVEGRELIEIFVVERPNHVLNHTLELDKIVEQPGRVEFLARHDDAHLIV